MASGFIISAAFGALILKQSSTSVLKGARLQGNGWLKRNLQAIGYASKQLLAPGSPGSAQVETRASVLEPHALVKRG